MTTAITTGNRCSSHAAHRSHDRATMKRGLIVAAWFVDGVAAGIAVFAVLVMLLGALGFYSLGSQHRVCLRVCLGPGRRRHHVVAFP